MTKKIKSICGDEPRRDEEYPTCYVVGYGGITHIIEDEEVLGDYGIKWFCVYKGSSQLAKMNARYVAAVEYLPDESQP